MHQLESELSMKPCRPPPVGESAGELRSGGAIEAKEAKTRKPKRCRARDARRALQGAARNATGAKDANMVGSE